MMDPQARNPSWCRLFYTHLGLTLFLFRKRSALVSTLHSGSTLIDSLAGISLLTVAAMALIPLCTSAQQQQRTAHDAITIRTVLSEVAAPHTAQGKQPLPSHPDLLLCWQTLPLQAGANRPHAISLIRLQLVRNDDPQRTPLSERFVPILP